MPQLGLKRGSVVVVPYNSEWSALFESEKAKLLAALGNGVVEVEHIGSTAVPGLAAKPLIDMMAVVPDISRYADYVQPLQMLGYEFMPERIFRDRVFFPKGPRSNRTYHLNLVAPGSAQWKLSLAFRDYLCSHDDARQEYQELKMKLAQLYSGNRELYTKAKNEFIETILLRR